MNKMNCNGKSECIFYVLILTWAFYMVRRWCQTKTLHRHDISSLGADQLHDKALLILCGGVWREFSEGWGISFFP